MSEPWQIWPSIWPTKASFFTYLRGQLRMIWSRYPAKLKWKQSQLVAPPKEYKGKAKKLGRCHYCGVWHPASSLEVDHVLLAGSCDSWKTANEFLYKLLDCNDNWVLADKECHRIKSYQERNPGMTFEEARVHKQVIALMKDKKKALALLHKFGVECRNDVQRREALTRIIKENPHEI